MSYATPDDLAKFLGTPAPANAQLLLDRATRLVRRAVMCAVYATDGNGTATDPTVVTALKNATLEQVSAWITLGSDGTPQQQYQTVTAGRISLGRGTTSATADAVADGEALTRQAYLELQQAGLTNQEPWLT